MKTLHFSIIVGIMLTSCLVLPNANAQDCFGGQSCGGKSSFSFMDGKNVAVNLKFYSNSTVSNNVHYLWLQFFDKNTNQTIPHVSFFLNTTKDDKVLMHELFYSHTGSMTLQFSSGSDMGKWIVSGTAEPVLGGMMSDNDMLPIEIPAFTPGTYHIHLVVLALVFANGLVDQNNPPTFDSWWSVDDKGNISKYNNNTIGKSLKFGNSTVTNATLSPLKQFKSGIKAEDIKCDSGLSLIVKAEDGSPACVNISSVSRLVSQGWKLPHVIQVENSKFSISYGILGGTLENATYDSMTNSIDLSTNTSDKGFLNIQLSRLLIDSKDKSGKDAIWSILLDGKEIDYNETKMDNYRLVSFPFESGLQKVVIIPYCSSFPC